MNLDLMGQMAPPATVAIGLQGHLKKLVSGKVRDLFEVDEERLLFVASDRISAFDVVMENVSLTQLSSHHLPWPRLEAVGPGFCAQRRIIWAILTQCMV